MRPGARRPRAGRARRWKAMRCADFCPIPGRRFNSSINRASGSAKSFMRWKLETRKWKLEMRPADSSFSFRISSFFFRSRPGRFSPPARLPTRLASCSSTLRAASLTAASIRSCSISTSPEAKTSRSMVHADQLFLAVHLDRHHAAARGSFHHQLIQLLLKLLLHLLDLLHDLLHLLQILHGSLLAEVFDVHQGAVESLRGKPPRRHRAPPGRERSVAPAAGWPLSLFECNINLHGLRPAPGSRRSARFPVARGSASRSAPSACLLGEKETHFAVLEAPARRSIPGRLPRNFFWSKSQRLDGSSGVSSAGRRWPEQSSARGGGRRGCSTRGALPVRDRREAAGARSKERPVPAGCGDGRARSRPDVRGAFLPAFPPPSTGPQVPPEGVREGTSLRACTSLTSPVPGGSAARSEYRISPSVRSRIWKKRVRSSSPKSCDSSASVGRSSFGTCSRGLSAPQLLRDHQVAHIARELAAEVAQFVAIGRRAGPPARAPGARPPAWMASDHLAQQLAGHHAQQSGARGASSSCSPQAAMTWSSSESASRRLPSAAWVTALKRAFVRLDSFFRADLFAGARRFPRSRAAGRQNAGSATGWWRGACAASVVARMKSERGGGSSSVFSSALKASVVSMCDFIDDEDLVAVARGQVADRFAQLADFVDAAVRGRVDFEHVHGISRRDFHGRKGTRRRASPSGPCTQLSALARMRAVVVLPTPRAPEKM